MAGGDIVIASDRIPPQTGLSQSAALVVHVSASSGSGCSGLDQEVRGHLDPLSVLGP